MQTTSVLRFQQKGEWEQVDKKRRYLTNTAFYFSDYMIKLQKNLC